MPVDNQVDCGPGTSMVGWVSYCDTLRGWGGGGVHI